MNPRTQVLPEGIGSLAEEAFHSCTALTEVMLPASLSSLGNHAFESCSNLAVISVAAESQVGWQLPPLLATLLTG